MTNEGTVEKEELTEEQINEAMEEYAAGQANAEPSEQDLLDQEEVKAELEYGQAILKAEEAKAKKLQRISDRRAGTLEISESDGYGVKMWGGHMIFQCHYCPLDTPDFDEARMKEHMRIAHPEPRGPQTFDDNGNWIGD